MQMNINESVVIVEGIKLFINSFSEFGGVGMKKRGILIFYGIGIALLLIFTFYDLQISMTISTKSLWARIFEVIGEIPIIVLAIFSCAALIRFRNKAKIWASIISIIGFGVLFVLFSAMGGFMIWNYLKDNVAIQLPAALGFILALFFAVSAVLLLRLVPEEKKKETITFAIITLLYFVAILVVMNSIKATWGRMRLREMTDPLTQFTPWYVITNRGGFSNIYASFPSGHSMNSAAVILLTLLPSLYPRLEKRKNTILVIVFAWFVLVGTSRIVMGAHFASDVIVGIMLSVTLFLGIKNIICKVRQIDNSSIKTKIAS